MIYLKKFETHEDYEEYASGGTMVRPNVSYCEDVKDVHYNYIIDDTKQYFTTVALEHGEITFFPNNNNIISYSTDKGNTWIEENSIVVESGDSVMWKGTMSPQRNNGIGYFSSTCNFELQGNAMSLLFSDNFINQLSLEGKDGCFELLFKFATKLVSAENLILPATTLSPNCYNSMFNGCTSLTSAPQLPATTLAIACYQNMFYYCTSLTSAPTILPATTLAEGCYGSMFYYCTSLTSAPELPATTLTRYCYSSMFSVCTSLTIAPELLATTLAEGCYGSMFFDCTNLKYIKAIFTTKPSNTYTDNWVYGVAASGTFVKNSAAQWDVSGVNGIPNGWTVQTASE